MSTWLDRAREFIAAIDVPEGATLAERKRIVQAEAWRFHGSTSWGQRIWARAKREYLERHDPNHVPPPPPKRAEPVFPADIIFPFRDLA